MHSAWVSTALSIVELTSHRHIKKLSGDHNANICSYGYQAADEEDSDEEYYQSTDKSSDGGQFGSKAAKQSFTKATVCTLERQYKQKQKESEIITEQPTTLFADHHNAAVHSYGMRYPSCFNNANGLDADCIIKDIEACIEDPDVYSSTTPVFPRNTPIQGTNASSYRSVGDCRDDGEPRCTMLLAPPLLNSSSMIMPR